jgi:hypothetical protein
MTWIAEVGLGALVWLVAAICVGWFFGTLIRHGNKRIRRAIRRREMISDNDQEETEP